MGEKKEESVVEDKKKEDIVKKEIEKTKDDMNKYKNKTKEKLIEYEKKNKEMMTHQKKTNEEMNRLKLDKEQTKQKLIEYEKQFESMQTKILKLEDLTKKLKNEIRSEFDAKNEYIKKVLKKEMDARIEEHKILKKEIDHNKKGNLDKNKKKKEEKTNKEMIETKQRLVEYEQKYDNMQSQMLALQSLTKKLTTDIQEKMEDHKNCNEQKDDPEKNKVFEQEQQEEGGININLWLGKQLKLPQYLEIFIDD